MISGQIESSQREERLARHLAAHAVAAQRAGIRVELLTFNGIREGQSGVRCEWRQARTIYNDDRRLLIWGFALAYIGGLIDEGGANELSDLHRFELKSDMELSEILRETAVEWKLAPSIQDTNPFAHSGYKLASRLIKRDRTVIDALAALLIERTDIGESALLAWFDENAPSYPLEELENSGTY
jgi:hypothetical protein